MTSMDRTCFRLGQLGLAAVFGTTAGTAVAQDGQPMPPALQAYKAELHPVNNSGVSGIATIVPSADGAQLTVTIAARNLEAGQPHPQHIHGHDSGEISLCATLAQDMDGNNLLSTAEAAVAGGPPLLPLEPFPTSVDGTITYGQMLPMAGLEQAPLTARIVELHGMTIPGGAYDETIPVACGEIVPALPELLRDQLSANPPAGGAGMAAAGQ